MSSGNSGGDTLGVEAGQTIAQERASGVAAEIRRLGEEAFRLGEKIRNDAEAFAQEELRAVTEMETFLRKELGRLRHIEQIMRTARAPALPPAPQLEDATHGQENEPQQDEAEH
jgi:hypothetical protein